MNNEIIVWNEAKEIAKTNKKKESKSKEDLKERVESAAQDFYDRLASPNFSSSEFGDVCSDYGIDEDDLFNRLI